MVIGIAASIFLLVSNLNVSLSIFLFILFFLGGGMNSLSSELTCSILLIHCRKTFYMSVCEIFLRQLILVLPDHFALLNIVMNKLMINKHAIVS